ncbi:MAG: transketolase family protein [Firmicutes bacterium]|nr:transketolase family protein [Bacillota bacterium]
MNAREATRASYGAALVELGRQDPRVVVLDADLSKSTYTSLFAREFPHRHFNMGIAEQNMMGVAAGLASAGKIPFASTFAVFATGRCFDQLRVSICYPALNVKIGASHAGITVGEDGASHQAVEDLALMCALPNMTVVVPADGPETRQAVFAAAAQAGPWYLRLGRPPVPVVTPPGYRFQVGRGCVLREGSDVAIIACGVMVAEALAAAGELDREGIRAAVVNMSTIKPLDVDLLVRMARECRAVVTAEEHSVVGGLGAAVAAVLGEEYPVPLRRVGIQDRFGQSGKPEDLMAEYGLTAAEVARAARAVISRKRPR